MSNLHTFTLGQQPSPTCTKKGKGETSNPMYKLYQGQQKSMTLWLCVNNQVSSQHHMAMARCPAQSWHLCPWNLRAAGSTWPSFRNLHNPQQWWHQGLDAQRCSTYASGVPGHTKCPLKFWCSLISRRYCKSTVYSLLNKDCIFSFKSVTHLFSLFRKFNASIVCPFCASSLVACILHKLLHTGMPCPLTCLF